MFGLNYNSYLCEIRIAVFCQCTHRAAFYMCVVSFTITFCSSVELSVILQLGTAAPTLWFILRLNLVRGTLAFAAGLKICEVFPSTP